MLGRVWKAAPKVFSLKHFLSVKPRQSLKTISFSASFASLQQLHVEPKRGHNVTVKLVHKLKIIYGNAVAL